MVQIDRNGLRATLLNEVCSAWEVLHQAHPRESFYSFGIYTTELVDYLMVTASTEEGLSAVTAKYWSNNGGDPALHRSSLRWSPCDSPLHVEGQGLLARSEAIRRQGPDPYEDSPESDEAVSMVFDLAVEILRDLDSEGLFGSDFGRSRLVLCVWKGDQSNEERVGYARALNPKAVATRFATELDDGNRAFVALSKTS